MTLTFVNGKKADQVSILERGLLYGDSLFETVAVQAKGPLLLEEHLDRLSKGIATLKFNANLNALKAEIIDFISHLNEVDCVLRITLSRGVGGRGYSPDPHTQATRILSAHEWPTVKSESLIVGLSEIKYAQQPLLAGIKHGNRLEQVLATQSIPTECDDVIMLDTENNVISASKGNIFLKIGGEWITPLLDQCGINGVIRKEILKLMKDADIPHQEGVLTLTELKSLLENSVVEEAFICNSIMGLTLISELLGKKIPSSQETLKFKALLQQQKAIVS